MVNRVCHKLHMLSDTSAPSKLLLSKATAESLGAGDAAGETFPQFSPEIQELL